MLVRCGGSSGWREDVPDGVTSSQSDPLRNWSVLLLSSRKLLLRAEGLVALFVRSHQHLLLNHPLIKFSSSPRLPEHFLPTQRAIP